MKKHIPNFITCLNLFSGCLALIFVFNGNPAMASILILLAMIFDFFDGMAARMLNVSSPLGIQLDSFADMVSFGVAPGLLLYSMMDRALEISETEFSPAFSVFYRLLPFLIPLCSALRLARFNLDEKQRHSFMGLPTPASGLMLASFPLIKIFDASFASGWMEEPVFLALSSCLLAFLMVSNISMFSFKFEHYSWTENEIRYLFLVFSISLIAVLLFTAIPIIILLYVVISIFENKFLNKKNRSNEIHS